MSKINDQTVNNLTSAICALIEAMGMQAANKYREHRNEQIAYTDDDFNSLVQKHNLTGF